LMMMDEEKPEHIFMSPPCSPWSQIQQINQRTKEQRAALSRNASTVTMFIWLLCARSMRSRRRKDDTHMLNNPRMQDLGIR
jgi:hypothetical protein